MNNFPTIAALGIRAFALALLVSLPACSSLFGGPGVSVTQTGEKAGANAVPAGTDPEDEVIGRREHPRIIANYGGQYEFRKAEIALAQMVSKLLTAADQPNLKFTITILDSAEINAFALPGGYIYVTRGILALANDASELAAVLAHEIAHVTLRHARDRTNRARTSEIADRVITDVFGGDIDTDQTVARARLAMAAFSQTQELVADKEGIIISGRAGYDPHAAARFLGAMGRFAAMASGEANESGDFLSSHPSTPDRIDKAVETARGFGAPGIGTTGRDRYLNAIDGLTFGENPEHGAVIGNRFVHPKLRFTFEVPENFELQNTENAVVGTAANGSALRFDSAEVPASMRLDDYMRSGWIAGLVEDSITTRISGDVEVATGLARTDQWMFRINAVRLDGSVYRFIFAASEDSEPFAEAARRTVDSFRAATQRDFSGIRTTLIRLVTARNGDTAETLAARMADVPDAVRLFQVLNNLNAGDQVTPGERYKIVTVE